MAMCKIIVKMKLRNSGIQIYKYHQLYFNVLCIKDVDVDVDVDVDLSIYTG